MDERDELQARVTELELRFMEQQRITDELSDVVDEQRRALDALALQLKRLSDKLAADPGLVERDADERPPHY